VILEQVTEDFMANRNFLGGGKLYTMRAMPVLVDMSFQVSATDSAGYGIVDLEGPLVEDVLMNTSATPAVAGQNPAAGTIVIRLQDNYNSFLLAGFSIQSPLSGSAIKIDNSAMTAGVAYVITVLGDATAAKWRAIGVPAGVTPAVGVSFIAASNGGAGNVLTSRVQATATAGSSVASIEIVGSPDLSIAPDPSLQSYGSQVILQCRDYAGALVAPAAGSIISLSLYLSNSSVSSGQ
jgi:hypothetical protein